jgi:hypothetical protein
MPQVRRPLARRALFFALRRQNLSAIATVVVCFSLLPRGRSFRDGLFLSASSQFFGRVGIFYGVAGVLTGERLGKLTGAFQPDFYLAANPDVATSGMHPWIHFMVFGLGEGRTPHALIDVGFLKASTQISDSFEALLAFSSDSNIWLIPASPYVDVDGFLESGCWSGRVNPTLEIYNSFPAHERFVHLRLMVIDSFSTDTTLSSASTIRSLFFYPRVFGNRREVFGLATDLLSEIPAASAIECLVAPGLVLVVGNGFLPLGDVGESLTAPVRRTLQGWYYRAPAILDVIDVQMLVVLECPLRHETLFKLVQQEGVVAIAAPNKESVTALKSWRRVHDAPNVVVLASNQMHRVRAGSVMKVGPIENGVVKGSGRGDGTAEAAKIRVAQRFVVFDINEWADIANDPFIAVFEKTGGHLVPIHDDSFDMWLTTLETAEFVWATGKYLQIVGLFSPKALVMLLGGKERALE